MTHKEYEVEVGSGRSTKRKKTRNSAVFEVQRDNSLLLLLSCDGLFIYLFIYDFIAFFRKQMVELRSRHLASPPDKVRYGCFQLGFCIRKYPFLSIKYYNKSYMIGSKMK